MTGVRRAAIAAAVAAALVHLPALGNGFTLDDTPIIQENPAAHSVSAALTAFDQPWWPPPHNAGQWRPLVTLSFAADWQASGGSAAWLHAVNLLWHAAAAGLVVLAVAPYAAAGAAGTAATLAGGLVFAVHPVHVEAVANLVGRAELMAAAFLLLALLAARRARSARAAAKPAWPAELAVVGFVALALLSKEHAAVALPLLLLDQMALPKPGARLPVRTYAAVTFLTAAWFMARRSIEGGQSFGTVAPTFFGLGTTGRLSTMGPVVFDLLRLLIWPFQLSPDYHPRVVERLEHPTLLGTAGFLMLGTLAALALLSWRRNRAAAAGLLIIGIGWLPTSNLLFASGIVLAERALYLPSVGLALLVAAGADALSRRSMRRTVLILLGLVISAFSVRTLTRIPIWASTRELVLDGVLTRPESYKVHQETARVLMRTRQVRQALREYGIAAELYDRDPFLLTEAGSAALAASQPRLALRFLTRSFQLDSNYTLTRQLLDRARGDLGDRAPFTPRR